MRSVLCGRGVVAQTNDLVPSQAGLSAIYFPHPTVAKGEFNGRFCFSALYYPPWYRDVNLYSGGVFL